MELRRFTATSGADLVLASDVVVKIGEDAIGDRIDQQTAWLEAHNGKAFPIVLTAWTHGVILPRYQTANPIGWASRALDTLEAHVWSQLAEVDLDIDVHKAFIAERCRVAAPETLDPLMAWCDDALAANADDLRRGLTHGDPTFDNTCQDEDRNVIFIDPNPARPAVPDLIACDLANVMQSLHGYEYLKYGAPRFERYDLEMVRRRYASTSDLEAAEYLTATKFARLLVYETTLRPVYRDLLHQLLRMGGYM